MPQKGKNCSWSEPATEEFLQLLVEYTTDNVRGISPTTVYTQWVGILRAKHNHICNVDLMRTKYQRFRKDYGLMRAIKDESGLGWSEEKQKVECPDWKWEQYCDVSFYTHKIYTRLFYYYVIQYSVVIN